jgi:hypothetical protein
VLQLAQRQQDLTPALSTRSKEHVWAGSMAVHLLVPSLKGLYTDPGQKCPLKLPAGPCSIKGCGPANANEAEVLLGLPMNLVSVQAALLASPLCHWTPALPGHMVLPHINPSPQPHTPHSD